MRGKIWDYESKNEKKKEGRMKTEENSEEKDRVEELYKKKKPWNLQ